jgi:hypothetical protein
MKYVQTIDAPVSAVVEPVDDLTQAELERAIKLMRDVKAKRVGKMAVELSPITGTLWITGWKRAG